MGTIQNSLNQMFASSIGLGFGLNRSPYFQGQREIKKAEAGFKPAQEMYDELLSQAKTTKTEIENTPDTEKVEDFDNKFQTAQADYAYKHELLDPGYEKNLKNLQETTLKHGTKKQREEVHSEVRSRLDEIIFGQGDPDELKDTIISLGDAYNAKRGVLEASQARREQITQLVSAIKGGVDREMTNLATTLRKKGEMNNGK